MKVLGDIAAGIGRGFEKGVNISRSLQEGFQGHELHKNQMQDFANRQQLFNMQMGEHEAQNQLIPIDEASMMLSPDSEYARGLLAPYAKTFSPDGTNIRRKDMDAVRNYANSDDFFQKASSGVRADLERQIATLKKEMNTGSISNIDKSLYQQKINALETKKNNIIWRSKSYLSEDESKRAWAKIDIDRQKLDLDKAAAKATGAGGIPPGDMLKYQKAVEDLVNENMKAYQNMTGQFVKVTVDKKGNRIEEQMTPTETLELKDRVRRQAVQEVSWATGIPSPLLLQSLNAAGTEAKAGDEVGGPATGYLHNRTTDLNPWTGLPRAGDPGTGVGLPGGLLRNTGIEANPLTGLPVTPRVQAITPPNKPRTLPPAQHNIGMNTPINDVLYNAYSEYQRQLRAVQGR